VLEVKSAQIDPGRWMRTTDLAEIDADGFLYIRGRADDAIIRGGFKVLPPDVEAAIRKHPSVKDVCVVGIADERLGAVPVAAVELHDGAPRVSADDLLAEARKHLVAYQVPVRVAVGELPRTPAMKVSKYEVGRLFQQ
jgi:acyl-CoA synthetase (AMP-forming)/AMP-acid ligase II